MKVKNNLKQRLGILLACVLGALALGTIGKTLVQYPLYDIFVYLQQLPGKAIGIALGCAALSYLTMTGYDVLAMRYIGRSLSWPKVGMAAFISYSFSTSLGLSVLASGSLRYRFYSAWGLSLSEVVRVVVFTALTGWLGILAIAGGMLIGNPLELPAMAYLPQVNSVVLGLIMLALPIAYLSLTTLWRRPITWGRWTLPIVGPRLACLQVGLGTLDWLVASTVLFVLLPSSETLSFEVFLCVFLLAQTAALISHVPAGVGVFESVVLLMLSTHLPAPQVFAALLVYRIIFYVLPLALAAVGLGLYESRYHRLQLSQAAQRLGTILRQCAEWLIRLTGLTIMSYSRRRLLATND